MNFNRVAPFYRTLETIAAGGKLQRCRTAFLEEIPTPRRILLAGEGRGRFFQECIRRFPHAEIAVVDSSEGMMKIAERTIAPGRADFIVADLLTWNTPTEKFDLIVTHFFLDSFHAEELARLIAKLGKMATRDAN